MTKFTKLQIQLHWLTLVLIAVTYAAMELRGWFPKDSSTYLAMRTIHYNAGVFVWLLMFFRLWLKHKYKDPNIVPQPPRWQMYAAKLMHIALYVTFLALPLLGIALMAYGGKSWDFLGFTISPFVIPDGGVKATIKDIHETLANVGYFLIALHAAAALFHHYIQKDNTLLRMMPNRKI
ncbi:cytochrome b [Hafnia paralvei]|uniref:cytochrome b n=1 Tax=Hafnia paralvei TaxID=546367 RepID=UPI00300C8AD3